MPNASARFPHLRKNNTGQVGGKMPPTAATLPMTEQDAPTLPQALYFTEDDLAANRNGHLSDEQAAQLQARAGCSTVGNTLVTLAFVGVGFWTIGIGQWWIGALLFGLGAAVFWLGRTGRVGITTELSTRAVASATGPISLDANEYANPNGTVTEYVLEIEDQAFVLSRQAFAAFEDGDTYTVYYLPQAHMLLSAEPMPQDV